MLFFVFVMSYRLRSRYCLTIFVIVVFALFLLFGVFEICMSVIVCDVDEWWICLMKDCMVL